MSVSVTESPCYAADWHSTAINYTYKKKQYSQQQDHYSILSALK